MAVGMTPLHPSLGWGTACDPRANLPPCQAQGASAGFEAAAFPFQRGTSFISICAHPTKPFPAPSSSPWSPHIPSSSSAAHSKPRGRKTVFGCVFVGTGKGGNRSSPGGSDGSQGRSLPTQGQPCGAPWLCVKASEAMAGLLPSRNVANCAVRNSCTFLTPLCLLPKHSTGQLKLIQGMLSPPSWQWLCCTDLLWFPCLHPFSPMPAGPTAGSHGTQGPHSFHFPCPGAWETTP